MEIIELLKIAAPILAVGGAWGGAKAALNGTRVRVKEIELRQASHEVLVDRRHIETIDRLARIETKLDGIVEKK